MSHWKVACLHQIPVVCRCTDRYQELSDYCSDLFTLLHSIGNLGGIKFIQPLRKGQRSVIETEVLFFQFQIWGFLRVCWIMSPSHPHLPFAPWPPGRRMMSPWMWSFEEKIQTDIILITDPQCWAQVWANQFRTDPSTYRSTKLRSLRPRSRNQ